MNKILQSVHEMDDCNIFLKIDVEGYEFRVLQSIRDELFPDTLYLEDSCDKSRNMAEWQARLDFFDRIENRGTDNVHVETRKGSGEYLTRYINIHHHRQFKYRKDSEALLDNLMFWVDRHSQQIMKDFVSESDMHLVDYLEFVFWMVNCHSAVIHYTDKDPVAIRSESPLFTSYDTDIVIAKVNNIKVKADGTITYGLWEVDKKSAESL